MSTKTEEITIFDKLDASEDMLVIPFINFHPITMLTNVKLWRNFIASLTMISAVFWAVLGFDSTWEQVDIVLHDIVSNPSILLRLSDTQIQTYISNRISSMYGLGNHWSAPVIYGIFFIAISLHLESVGIFRSYNFFITNSLAFMSIGLFEIPWNIFFAHLQGQWWTIDIFHWKQALNMWSFITFVFVLGSLSILYLYADNFKLNLSKSSFVLLFFAISLWALWIYYPLPVSHITVQTTAGPWTNTNLFPQTYYNIDVNPLDNYAAGTPFYVQNDIVHLLNTVTKIAYTTAILSFCWIRRSKKI